MGKKKQTNQVSWSTPPPTQATTALQGMVGEGVDYATPIRNSYARAKQGISRSYNNPLGAYTTAHVRDNAIREQNSNLDTRMGMDLANAEQMKQQAKFGQQATVAQLTSPQMYNSKTTYSDPLGSALGIGSVITGGLTGGLTGSGK